MKRSLIILMVGVLVIGGIGAAFATGMLFGNVGALSSAVHEIPEVNCDEKYYNIDINDFVVSVTLSFDSDLKAGSQIHVALLNIGGEVIDWGATPVTGLGSDLSEAESVIIGMDGKDRTEGEIYSDKVTVAPSFEP